MDTKYFYKIILACIFTLSLSVNAFSQNNQIVKKVNSLKDIKKVLKPNLNGHEFIVSNQTKSPFIQTALNLQIGTGQTVGFDLPPVVVDSNNILEGVQGDISLSNAVLQYSAKLNDWLAFWVNFKATGRFGTQTRSLIYEGINFSTGYEFGWLFKLWENKKNLLSGSIYVANNNYNVVGINDFIKGIIDSGRITSNNKLSYYVPSLSVMAGARYATAFNKSFGLMAILEFGYGESTDISGSDKFITNCGLTFDYNMLPKTNIPLGFSLGYFQNSTAILSQQRLNNPQNIVGQISYTGKPDLNLGIEMSYAWSKPPSTSYYDKSLQFLNISGTLIYYF
ncbi:MAG TPA: hypothetical protein PKD83_08640 [Ignavibacteria bacterium]|nr:hypothetical protein [Ignavibacteria bacterium]